MAAPGMNPGPATTYEEKLSWTKFHCNCDHAEGICCAPDGNIKSFPEVPPAPSFGSMTPAAKAMAQKIPACEIDGTLEHWSTSMSDAGKGCFIFGDETKTFKVYSDGQVTVSAE